MYRKLVFSIFCALLLLVFQGHTAYAHFPATDGSITAILHVEPDDNPIPGQSAMLYFTFDDANYQFSLAKCSCIVNIFEGWKEVASSNLTPVNEQSIYDAQLPFIFPSKDTYTITLHGNPRHAGDFQPFSVSWNFSVNQSPLGSEDSFSWKDVIFPLSAATGGSVLLFGSVFGFFALTKRKH